jgi:hypothetical protein
MNSLKPITLVVLTAVSVVGAGPPIRRSLSPLDVTLRSVSPHPAPATPGACRGADKLELQAARRELAAAKEELQREREEVKRLKQVEQRGAADEAAASLPLTAADVAELFRLLKDMNINEMRLEREMAGVRRELAELREEVKRGEAAEEAQATRGWWELGFEVGGFLQQREMASVTLMFAWAECEGWRFVRYWFLATVLHPVMGAVWGILALMSWMAVKGAAARDMCRRGWDRVRRWKRSSWLVKCLGCGDEDEEGEDRGQELEDVQLDGGDAAPPAAAPPAAPVISPTLWDYLRVRWSQTPLNSTVLSDVSQQ